MWIARISRNRGDKVTKDELSTNYMTELLEMLIRILDDGAEILEIHIFRGNKIGEKEKA